MSRKNSKSVVSSENKGISAESNSPEAPAIKEQEPAKTSGRTVKTADNNPAFRRKRGEEKLAIWLKAIVVDYYLEYAVFVADIEEHNAAVIADILDPARHANLLTDVFFSEFTAAYGAVNVSFYHQKLSFQRYFTHSKVL